MLVQSTVGACDDKGVGVLLGGTAVLRGSTRCSDRTQVPPRGAFARRPTCAKPKGACPDHRRWASAERGHGESHEHRNPLRWLTAAGRIRGSHNVHYRYFGLADLAGWLTRRCGPSPSKFLIITFGHHETVRARATTPRTDHAASVAQVQLSQPRRRLCRAQA